MKRIIAAVMLLAAAGCSDKAGSAPTTAATIDPLPSVAAGLHCTYKPFGPPEELYTLESGSCGPLTLYWFASSHARDEWLAVAGADAIVVKRGTNWLAVRE